MTESLDLEYLTGWSRQRQDAAQRDTDRCRLCSHAWHGLPCATFTGNGCGCETSAVTP